MCEIVQTVFSHGTNILKHLRLSLKSRIGNDVINFFFILKHSLSYQLRLNGGIHELGYR